MTLCYLGSSAGITKHFGSYQDLNWKELNKLKCITYLIWLICYSTPLVKYVCIKFTSISKLDYAKFNILREGSVMEKRRIAYIAI